MKKIIYLLVGVLLSLPSVATEMCARNDTIVIPLDSNVDGSRNGNDKVEHTWWTDFSYGRIYGLSTCLSAAEGGKPSGLMGVYTNDKGQMLPQDEAAGRTGQDPDGNDRGYCWCKMTHPAYSRWVFLNSYSDSSRCASSCTSDCGNRAHYYPDMRSGLFGSVGK